MPSFEELLKVIDPARPLVIQPHDFPDPDAIACAFALQYLLQTQHYNSQIVYFGEIQRQALVKMINDLGITVLHLEQVELSPLSQLIIVDGCKGNKNITDLGGVEIAVIDHHKSESPENVPFVDIRPSYGSCSSIIYEYFLEFNIPLPPAVANALLIGLEVDTNLLTRNVSDADIFAFALLHATADQEYVNRLLRNNIQQADLVFFIEAMSKARFSARMAFYYFPGGCAQNLLGIIANFLLSIQEVNFVVLAAKNTDRVIFSVRSEEPSWPADSIIRNLLRDLGAGGGHKDMAGGIVSDPDLFDADIFFSELEKLLHS